MMDIHLLPFDSRKLLLLLFESWSLRRGTPPGRQVFRPLLIFCFRRLASLYLGSVVHSLTLGHAGPGAWDVHSVELFAIDDQGQVSYLRVEPADALADGRELDITPSPPPAPEPETYDV